MTAMLAAQVAGQSVGNGDIYSDYNYCQGISPIAHKTYKPMKDAVLKKVQVMMRHGDRTPASILPGDHTNYNICNNPAEYNFVASNDGHELYKKSSPALKTNIVVSEKENPFAAEFYWRGNCEVGQLTNRGSTQTRQVGQNLRAIYVNQLHFLPKTLDPEELYVRNTYVWRTKESAENFMGGLYPEKHRQSSAVVTLNTYPQSIDTLFFNPTACPKLGQMNQAFQKTPTFAAYLKKNHALMQKVNSVLGVSHLPAHNSSLNGDIIMPRYCNKLPLGCSAQDPKNCLTAKEVIEANTQTTFPYSAVFRYESTAEEFKRLSVGPFLKTLSDSIRATTATSTSQKKGKDSKRHNKHKRHRVRPFEFYSAHDQSLDQVLAVISEPNTPWPGYAATLILETWTLKNKKDVIRVLFEGKVVPANPKLECTLDACPLETFLKFIDSYVPTNVAKECSPASA
ncbi:Acid phosphatase-like protein 2 [Mortierella sp. GBA30]|nr:Acid phosphatase-like protein 2 [Mortierella sp. GBA30]